MESRETQVGTTYDRPEHATVETEDGSEMIREDEAPTVESIRPKGRRLVAGRLLSRQVMLERITPMVRGVSGKRFVTGLAVLAMVIALLGVVLVPNLPPQVQLAIVKQDNIVLHVSGTGTLQSAIYDANFSGNGGKIAEIDVAVGQTVTEGQTLAKLDTTLLQDAVKEAQTAVTAAQTRVSDAQMNQSRVQAQADAEVSAAYSQEQAALKQCGTNTKCQQAAEDAYAAAQARSASETGAAQAQVNDAQSQLAAAQARLQTAQDTLSRATLTAPHAGTVAAVNSSVGSVVGGSGSAGSLGGAPFIRIADLSELQVQAFVSVADVGAVAKGQMARFTVPSVGSVPFQGTVGSVSPLGQVMDNTLTYPVTVDVDTAAVRNGRLLPGMAANVTITTQERFGVLVIPASAVIFARAAADRSHGGFLTKAQVDAVLKGAQQLALEAQDSGIDMSQATVTYVLERKKDAWVAKPVLLGVTDGRVYEVLAGLSKGEKVATSEKNVLGFTIGPVAPTPTPTPVSR
ncbi:MAG: efflux RND transporter periplasmic adaptor subunit [Ktedonobacterales bacterium]